MEPLLCYSPCKFEEKESILYITQINCVPIQITEGFHDHFERNLYRREVTATQAIIAQGVIVSVCLGNIVLLRSAHCYERSLVTMAAG